MVKKLITIVAVLFVAKGAFAEFMWGPANKIIFLDKSGKEINLQTYLDQTELRLTLLEQPKNSTWTCHTICEGRDGFFIATADTVKEAIHSLIRECSTKYKSPISYDFRVAENCVKN